MFVTNTIQVKDGPLDRLRSTSLSFVSNVLLFFLCGVFHFIFIPTSASLFSFFFGSPFFFLVRFVFVFFLFSADLLTISFS